MALADDLRSEVKSIFSASWETSNGRVVPETTSIGLGNKGVVLDAVALYADLADSTGLVDRKTAKFSAEVFKTFLICACKVIRNNGGEITAFDGDRVMGVFVGDSKNSDAVRTGLQINWVVQEIVNPALKNQYPQTDYVVEHGVGIDSGELLVARTGIRGSNDLVWVGPAANYAAKLSSLRSQGFPTWVSERVFNRINDESKYSNKVSMWEPRTWSAYNQTIYRSSYWWRLK